MPVLEVLADYKNIAAADHKEAAPTVCAGGLGPDVVAAGAGVLPQVALGGRQEGLGLAHRQVRGLPAGELVHHLRVVLRLEPGHHTLKYNVKVFSST